MNHPYLVTLGLLALTAASWWGLMKLEAIEPKKPSKRRRGKRKKNKITFWKLFKRLFRCTLAEFLWIIATAVGFTLIFAVIIKDLILAIIATATLVILHFKIQSIQK